jgi:hypothetical protein
MKSIWVFCAGLACAPWVYAQTYPASSLKTSTGTLLHVGDSYQTLQARMGQSPNAMRSEIVTKNQQSYTALYYVYELDGKRYTITVIDNRVTNIEWESLNP